MSTIDELLEDLSTAVGDRDISYNSSSAACDIYEGYAFGLVLRAATASGANIVYRDRDGNKVSNLLFRTSPGMLYSKVHAYTHAELSFPDCPPLEVHVGVRVQGRSGVLHECDVLVLPISEAELSREREVAPRGSRSLIAIECKYYSSYIALHLARGFHGLHADLGVKTPIFMANLRAPRIERFLTYHDRRWELGALPGSKESVYLEAQVRESFKAFQSKEGTLAF
jgi:hypothetical protein